jgi:ABC-2 type transport system ATP-binding protein
LTRHFGGIVAVDDLSFDVKAGELFGIVGPDGAGKTTTLRMLAGILRPTSGDAHLAGVSVTRDPEAAKHHFAYMSQRFGLYTDLTVRENIEFYADLYRVPQHERPPRMQRLYEFSQLGEFEGRLAGQLSGGMKQKLSVCCSLIHRPQIMLLDEPTFGVDPISRRDLWLIIHQMVSEGMTVLVSTAYLDEAERCDRVALLHEGRLVALERPVALQQRLAGQIIAVRADDPRRAREHLQPLAAVRHAVLFGETVHVVLEDVERDWPAVQSALVAADVTVLETTPIAPSLEDVFIDLVAGTEYIDD